MAHLTLFIPLHLCSACNPDRHLHGSRTRWGISCLNGVGLLCEGNDFFQSKVRAQNCWVFSSHSACLKAHVYSINMHQPLSLWETPVLSPVVQAENPSIQPSIHPTNELTNQSISHRSQDRAADILAREAVGHWAARVPTLTWPSASLCGVGAALDYTVPWDPVGRKSEG